MKSLKHIILLFNLVCCLGLFAQHNEEVTIEGSYRPKVNKVDKIKLNPETPEQAFTIPETEVKVLDVERKFHLPLNKLGHLNYSSKKGFGDDVANNFLMAGFGSRISPVFLYRHNSNLSKNIGLSVGLKHYSSWLDIKEYAPSGFMNNAVELGLTHRDIDGFQLAGKVYYKNDVYHYYGFKIKNFPWDVEALEHAAPRQVYNTIGTHWDLASTKLRLGELMHDVSLDYHYLFGKVGDGREHVAKLDYDLSYADSWWGKKEYPQKTGVVLTAQYGYNDLMELKAANRLLLKVNPYFEMKGDFYRLHLGVGVDGATKFNTAKGLFRVYPDLKGSIFVLNNSLEFYAALNGGRKWCNYRDLIEENPFVSTRLNMEIASVKLGVDAGVRTNILNTVDIHLGFRYRHTENDYFFRQRFTPAYDGMTIDRPYSSFDLIYDETRLISVLTNVRWLVLDNLTVDAGFAYNKCDPTTEEHAWYRPSMVGDLNVSYQPIEDLSLNATFSYQGGRWGQYTLASGKPGKTVKLDDGYDLGIGAEYRFKEHLAVFVKADNLLNRKYQFYLDYPVTGIEAFAGLKLAF